MVKTGIIYRWYCKDTQKSYIGQTLYPRARYKAHILSAKNNGSERKFSEALGKYNQWEYEILESGIPRNELNNKEIYYISLYDSYNNGYNLTPGGRQAAEHVVFTKEHIEALKKSWTAERKQQASQTQKLAQLQYWSSPAGKIKAEHHAEVMKGRTATEETKQKLSAALKGRTFSEETRQKLSEANKGRTATEETKQKLSAAHKGKPCPTKGKHKVWNKHNDHSAGFHYE